MIDICKFSCTCAGHLLKIPKSALLCGKRHRAEHWNVNCCTYFRNMNSLKPFWRSAAQIFPPSRVWHRSPIPACQQRVAFYLMYCEKEISLNRTMEGLELTKIISLAQTGKKVAENLQKQTAVVYRQNVCML